MQISYFYHILNLHLNIFNCLGLFWHIPASTQGSLAGVGGPNGVLEIEPGQCNAFKARSNPLSFRNFLFCFVLICFNSEEVFKSLEGKRVLYRGATILWRRGISITGLLNIS